MNMKQAFLISVLIVSLTMLAGWLANRFIPQPPAAAVTEQGITMLPSTVPISARLQLSTLRALALDAYQRGVTTYAITDVVDRDGYWKISVAGMPDGSQQMALSESVWLGTVTINNTTGLPGLVDEAMPKIANSLPEALGSETAAAEYGVGGSANILPFRSGTTAMYGTLGVHDCGFSMNGWKAVDLFPSENMVYSSNSGTVSYVCRDENQVALRIGNNLYTHLVDTGQQMDDVYTQGQAIAGMVPGSFDTACGYAAQNEAAYHVHFCFVPNSGGGFNADGYMLSMADSNWRKGSEMVEPTGTLTAAWEDAGFTGTTARASGNFWDSLIGGVIDMANNSMNVMPEHHDFGIVSQIDANVAPALTLINLLFGSFNCTVPLWVGGIIFVLETVRIVYAGWMWIKKAIPVIG
jgi:hypothetical protein